MAEGGDDENLEELKESLESLVTNCPELEEFESELSRFNRRAR